MSLRVGVIFVFRFEFPAKVAHNLRTAWRQPFASTMAEAAAAPKKGVCLAAHAVGCRRRPQPPAGPVVLGCRLRAARAGTASAAKAMSATRGRGGRRGCCPAPRPARLCWMVVYSAEYHERTAAAT